MSTFTITPKAAPMSHVVRPRTAPQFALCMGSKTVFGAPAVAVPGSALVINTTVRDAKQAAPPRGVPR